MSPAQPLEPRRYTIFDHEWDVLQRLVWQARNAAIQPDPETTLRRLTSPAVVEIGARDGSTTERLWRECIREGLDLHVVDPWDGNQDSSGQEMFLTFEAARATWPVPKPHDPTYTGHIFPTPTLTIHRKRSQEMTPPDDLVLVFHDGDHRDLSDLSMWYDALVPRGILAVHDLVEPGWPRVRFAWDALGPPWHEYRYVPSAEDRAIYGPSVRGLGWRVKP